MKDVWKGTRDGSQLWNPQRAIDLNRVSETSLEQASDLSDDDGSERRQEGVLRLRHLQ
jgi:hypothetical protein